MFILLLMSVNFLSLYSTNVCFGGLFNRKVLIDNGLLLKYFDARSTGVKMQVFPFWVRLVVLFISTDILHVLIMVHHCYWIILRISLCHEHFMLVTCTLAFILNYSFGHFLEKEF